MSLNSLLSSLLLLFPAHDDFTCLTMFSVNVLVSVTSVTCIVELLTKRTICSSSAVKAENVVIITKVT